ncbi:MAG: DUF4347 domain-containing protein, partial [Planctomycetota bacterium]
MSNEGSNRPTQAKNNWGSQDNVEFVNESASENLHLVSLEERVLYSAVPVPVDLVDFVDVESAGVDNIDVFESADNQLNLLENGLEQFFDATDDAATDLGVGLEATDIGSENFELIVVDQSVEGYEQFVDDILKQDDPNTQYEIAFLDSSSDGVKQISQIFQQSGEDKSYQAVHLVTHGSDATLNLGQTQMDGSNIHGYASELIQWQSSLTEDADFLIYGCEVGATEAGENFIQEIADLTGTDVAASDDLTGHASLGGDWEFEIIVGDVQTDSAFSEELEVSWTSTLDDDDDVVRSTSQSSPTDAVGRQIGIADDGSVVQVYTVESSWAPHGNDIFYNIVDADGNLQGEVKVNQNSSSGEQHSPAVAVAGNGDFVVVWTDDLDDGTTGIFAKYYDATGDVIKDEFRIDPSGIGVGADDAAVAIDSRGNFVVAWEGEGAIDDQGIFAKRFDAAGAVIQDTFLVNSIDTASLSQGNVDVAMNDSGQFAIAWDTFTSNDQESTVYARWFDQDGAGNPEFIVDSLDGFVYQDPSISINSSGNFVVSYTSDVDQDLKDTPDSTTGFIGREFQSEVLLKNFAVNDQVVTQVGNNQPANQTSSGSQHSSSVTLLDNNQVAVVWQGEGYALDENGNRVNDEEGAFKRIFDISSGEFVALSDEAFIDPVGTDGEQKQPAIASNGEEFAILYQDQNEGLQLATSFAYDIQVSDTSLTLQQGFSYAIQTSDLGYNSSNAPLAGIVIESLPPSTGGILVVDGASVSVGQQISVSDIEAGKLAFQPSDTTLGSVGQIEFRAFDGTDYSKVNSIQITTEFSPTLLIGTSGQQTNAVGESWDDTDIVAVGGNDFQLGSDTVGDIYKAIDTQTPLDAFHLVNKTITRSDIPGFSLEPGDVVLSLQNAIQVTNGAVSQPGDILAFRPNSAGDYDLNNGLLFVLSSTETYDKNIKSVTVVESDTLVGDYLLKEGDILFTHEDDGAKINRLYLDDGEIKQEKFIDGGDVGIDQNIHGLDIVEQDTVIGGRTLTAGTVLMSFEDAVTRGGVDFDSNDVAAYTFNTTELGAGSSTVATAELLFDRTDLSDVSVIDQNGRSNSDVTAISLMTAPFGDATAGDSTDDPNDPTPTLYITTKGTQSFGGTEWDQTDVAAISGNDFTLGPNSTSTAYTMLDSVYDLDAFHFVNSTVTVDLNPPVTVEYGDVLFSVHDQVTIPGVGIQTEPGDILLFKPSSPGNYNLMTGTFSRLTQTPSNDDVRGISLVEQDTVVGDFTLKAGEILFTDSDETAKVQRLSTTNGTLTQDYLLDSNDLDAEHAIQGLELIETDMEIGGKQLKAGTLLLSFEKNGSMDGTSYQDNDIVAVELTQTQLGSGSSAGTGSLFLDASNSDLSGGGDGDIEAISIGWSESLDQELTNADPVLVNNETISVGEGQSVVLSNSMLQVTDSDNSASELTYELTSKTDSGTIMVNGSPVSSFTQDDIDNGRVSYVHNGSEPGAESVNLKVTDPAASATSELTLTLNIDVSAVNDAAVLSTVNDIMIDEGDAYTLTQSDLETTDADDNPAGITYTVTNLPNGGSLFVNGSALSVNGTFTQANINDGLVEYRHNDASSSAADLFEF